MIYGVLLLSDLQLLHLVTLGFLHIKHKHTEVCTASGHLFVYACILPYQWYFVGSTVQSTHLRNVLDKTPEKYDLLELLAEVQDRWFDIGEMLKVNNASLKCLRQSNLSDSTKLADTLQLWIDSASSPVTWGTIVEVLRTDYINLPRVADKIEDKLSTQLYDKYCHRPSNVNFRGIIIINPRQRSVGGGL